MATNEIQITQLASAKEKEEVVPMLSQIKEDIQKISYLSLFISTSGLEKFLMVIGILGALGAGVGLPLFSLVFGDMTNNLGDAPDGGAKESKSEQAGVQASYFIYIGLGIFVGLSLAMSIYLTLCEKISCRIRKAYFAALMNQEIGWFDMLNPNELAAKVALDTQTIQKGIGESIPTFFMSCSTVIAGFIMGFARGWELSLVLIGALPFIAVAGGLFAYVLTSMKTFTDIAYIHAGGLAEQSLNAIKTVKALSSEDFELENFNKELREGIKVVKKFALFAGFAIGFLFFCFLGDNGLGFWFGSILIEHERENVIAGRPYNLGDVMTIFLCITMGSMIMAQIPPPLKSFVQAKESGANVFYVIKRQPKILINDPKKAICQNVTGQIIIKDVNFSYPSRPDQMVLKKVNIEIQKNKKTAFVGESGSGKSTLVAMLERFYDPSEGGIYLDGVDIRTFNLKSYRKKIGYVGQEPVLFSGTIRENLLYGKEDATAEELKNALIQAKAYEFVQNLEHNMDTFIGIGGNQISGGQKQRIAIARAILKNPPILLLDEATSALDRTNEMAIQKTLDEISGGRTTIVIAHRLTTIQDADRIYVMSNGVVDDYGTHQELLNKHGKYEALVKIQLSQNNEDKEKNTETNQIEVDSKLQELNYKNPSFQLNKKPSFAESNAELKKHSFSQVKQPSFHENVKQPSFSEKMGFSIKEELEKEIENVEKIREKELKEEVEILKKTGKYNEISHKVFKRLFKDYILPHYCISFLAYFCSMCAGACQPAMSILMGSIMEGLVMISYKEYRAKAREDVDLYAGMFVVLGGASLIFNAFCSYCFSLLGEKVSFDLKSRTYDITLRRQMSYFDKSENNPGIISSRISYETQNINRLISSFFGVFFNGIGAFACGIVISLIYSWQIALLAIGLSPIIIFGHLLQTKIHTGFAGTDEAYNEAGALVMETAVNMRTVASFCNEDVFIKKFNEKINKPLLESNRKGIISGLSFGFSQFLMYAFFAVMFYVAAVLQENEGLGLKEFFVSLFAIIQAAAATGNSSSFLPDVGQSVISAEKIFEILDAKDMENYKNPADLKDIEFKGHVSIKNIFFKYPNAEKYLFENFSLEVPAGKKIAFVGPSGCGKSTLFQLLLGFYPIEKGEISIDGMNITKMDVKQLRSLFGIVSQEPTLFQGTVAYNIKYNRNATMEEIRKAAEEANALKFIEANQFDVVDEGDSKVHVGMGFDRQVGSKGSQISGGQKQRLAIARAIIRHPRILLLDEATSALDAQNEEIVQESLNKLMVGKTSIVIAHRISTIKDADEILVFGEGKIVERGQYDNLVKMQGVFYKFERGFANK